MKATKLPLPEMQHTRMYTGTRTHFQGFMNSLDLRVRTLHILKIRGKGKCRPVSEAKMLSSFGKEFTSKPLVREVNKKMSVLAEAARGSP